MPSRLRTDNGPPFATAGIGGLSAMAVCLIRLGVTPERIDPGHPEQNGCHERMHKTLKQEATSPPGKNLIAQQLQFDLFRGEFNDVRPHEALGQKTPASVYSPRRARCRASRSRRSTRMESTFLAWIRTGKSAQKAT